MLPAFFRTAAPQIDLATRGSWQIVCVDDGSTDETFSIIAREHMADSRVAGIRLSRNFGHQAALSVGLAFAEGEYIGIADCDLQDPIEVLVQLYQKVQDDDLDVCYGVRTRREGPITLRLAYALYYRLIRRMAEHQWPKDAGDFCVISARCQRVLLSLPEHSRMIRGLRSWVGFRQTGVSYNRPRRLHGKSKYNIRKLYALALQGLIAFSSIPLRLASFAGLGMGGFSMLFGLLVILNRFFPRFTMFGYWVGANPGVTTLVCFLALAFSILFVSIGIIGEYLVVLLQEVKRRPTAIVESVVGAIQKNDLAYNISYPMGTEAPRESSHRAGSTLGD
jgi:dolichol-phosphate mannosyltransferase